MKIDISSKQTFVSESNGTKAEAQRIGKRVRAALKDESVPTAQLKVTPSEKGVTVYASYHNKTMRADFQNLKNYSRAFKDALKNAGLKVGGIKQVMGPGSKFSIEVRTS